MKHIPICNICNQPVWDADFARVNDVLICKYCNDRKQKRPENSMPTPSYENETLLRVGSVKLVDDAYSPPLVEFSAELQTAMKLVQSDGSLKLQWVRRAVWLQVPLENVWMLSEGAQVPLTVVKPNDKDS